MRQFFTVFVVSLFFGPALLIVLVGAVMAQETQAERGAPARRGAMPFPLKVIGTRVVNSENENVRLRGVNTAGLEWSSDGEGHILTR